MNCRSDLLPLRKPLRLPQIYEKLPRIAFVEYSFDAEVEVKIPARVKKNDVWGDMLMFTDGEGIALMSYGLTWRLWADAEPTKKQREAAEWIRDEMEEKVGVRIL